MSGMGTVPGSEPGNDAAFRARFQPPAVERSAALREVLAAAFSSVWPSKFLPAKNAGPADLGVEVLHLARRLALAPRVAARCGRERMAEEWGNEVAEALVRDRHLAVALMLEREALSQEFGEVALGAGVPWVALKAGALDALGVLAPGSRPSADLDVLVRERDGPRLLRALEAAGFRGAGGEEYEHHWPALRPPRGSLLLELHREIPGLRAPDLPGRRPRFATLEDLERCQALRPAAAVSGGRVPVEALVLAHLAVHAWAQHRDAPGAYPALVSVADARDLGGFTDGDDRFALAHAWTGRDLDPGTLDAFAALVEALGSTDLAGPALDRATPAGRLLDHAVAGALDDTYVAALQSRWVVPALSRGPRWLGAVKGTWTAIFGRREAPITRLGQIARRLLVSRNAARELRAPASVEPLSLARKIALSWIVTRSAWDVWRATRREPLLEVPDRLRHEARPLSAGRKRPQDLARAVHRLAPFLPPRALGPCLRQSLLLIATLARCGIRGDLHCGLRRKSEGGWEGHAWVSVDGVAVTPQPAIPPGFVEIWQA